MSDAATHIATRRALIALMTRRQRPGSGSRPENLMKQPRVQLSWWQEPHQALGSIPHAVIGAVAANRHMPPRETGDINFGLRLADLERAEVAIAANGWVKAGSLSLAGGLNGSSWEDADSNEVDLIGIPGTLGDEVVAAAHDNEVGGLPHATLPYLVVLKMISSRGRDIGDLTSMLGAASDGQLDAVREAVRRHGPREDIDDLEQLIVAGKLERQAQP